MRIWLVSFTLVFGTIVSYAQIENRWQPDSIYANKNIRKMYVYMNTPKDISEIVEFDKTGKRIRLTKYSASYNKRMRRYKSIQRISHYNYDDSNRLISIEDSIGNYSTTYNYGTDGTIISSQQHLGNFKYDTHYSFNPYTSITISRKDSNTVYEMTKEYDKAFYVKRIYGYTLEPKLKTIERIVDGVVKSGAYQDHNNLIKYKDDKILKNEFDYKGNLVKSSIKSVLMNDRVNEFELIYKYYKNGLLKSIRGYVPRYFQYEFHE